MDKYRVSHKINSTLKTYRLDSYFLSYHLKDIQYIGSNGKSAHLGLPLLAKYVREHLQYILVRDNGKQGLLKYVYEGGCYRLYADNMLLGIIKKYIADYDEELVKMSKVNEVLLHITTDLTYVSQDALNADEDIINFQNGILKITATDTELIPHSADILSTIQLPCEWSDEVY